MGMVDLHNHLLPGIDDGAEDLGKSLELARIAVGDGITHLVCTPHIHPGRYDNSPDTIQPALEAFRSGLINAGIKLSVSSAAEVRFGLELMEGVARQAIPFLGEWQGRKVLLLEFPHGEIPFGAERLTQWLIDRKILPMIAHPERNKALMKTPSKLKPFLTQGCLLQVTAASVAGRFGEAAEALAHQLLAEDRVTVLATDAHNVEHRPPILREGVKVAAQLLGDKKAAELVTTNPWSIAQVHFS
ncbi:Manganese-dependent protein-tyrosine phosphatase [Marinobacterium lacunae]|uniref:protein-tyrosine-phosphatase n=1 Tax=Marinobacterium lacunae TaxID=1232683 RepID=A0A081G0A6_9GAMM|nr:CpsB/CapC family capsule biosynthesis tyrosine phosphatase [Marinobacterium lacunae]KEA64211.1 Manganese-dependent protein-tyrosine phosphatase [Marinobacterium lacunae]